MRKAYIITGAALAALGAAQLYVLGDRGGFGPLGFLRDRRMAAHPGNAPEYGFDMLPPEESPLKGKRVLVLGSSVVYGAASGQDGIAELLTARTGCSCQKEAVCGTTLCDINPASYVSRLKRVDTAQHFDFFLCQLSTNDARKTLPLGEPDSTDPKTVCGAINTIIDYVRSTWGCPVAFFTGSRYGNKHYAAMVELLLQIADKKHIKVVDLWNSAAFNDIPVEKRSLYMNDGVHPTRAGYRDWWGPELLRQMNGFLAEEE